MQKKDDPIRPVDNEKLRTALSATGKAVNVVSIYGENHPASDGIAKSSHKELAAYLDESGSFSLGSFNGLMTVNGKAVMASDSLMKGLQNRLVNLHISSMRIRKGLSFDEFRQLIALLNQGDPESFRKNIAKTGLKHIESEDAEYMAVKKSETVTDRTALEQAGETGSTHILDLDSQFGNEESGGITSGGTEQSAQIQQIMAFLQGEAGGSSELQEELDEMLSDPKKLGQMILESVSVRQAMNDPAQGESLCDVILGCLRKTYAQLEDAPRRQSEKEKVNLNKSMLLLEKNIIDKMRGMIGNQGLEVDQRILHAVHEMEQNIEAEVVAVQYLEHRAAVERSEKKIISYIQENGVEAAQKTFSRAGLSAEQWSKVIIGSQPAKGTPEGGMLPGANLGTLAVVLEKLEELMGSDSMEPARIQDTANEIRQNIEAITDNTRQQISKLEDQIRIEKKRQITLDSSADEMAYDELLKSIAEIAQELLQPLTVIKSSLDMMLAGFTGRINEEQKDLLIMAGDSGTRLRGLMNNLIRIVGFPVSRIPEKERIQNDPNQPRLF